MITEAALDEQGVPLSEPGMPHADIKRTSSGALADQYGAPHPPLRRHDALDDALSVAHMIQLLLRRGALIASDLQ